MLEAGAVNSEIAGTAYSYRSELQPRIYDLVVARSLDRGNVPISRLVTNVVEMFRPEFLILSGIAGGVGGRDDVQLGDVVVADHVDWYEMRKMAGGENKYRRQAVDHPSAYLRDAIIGSVERKKKWIEGIKVERPHVGLPKMIEGNVIAGDKVLGDTNNAYQKMVLDEHDKALAVDMESYGLGRAVYECRGTRGYNLGYVVVRGISDLVEDEQNNTTRVKWRNYAAATAAAFSVHVADAIIAADAEARYGT